MENDFISPRRNFKTILPDPGYLRLIDRIIICPGNVFISAIGQSTAVVNLKFTATDRSPSTFFICLVRLPPLALFVSKTSCTPKQNVDRLERNLLASETGCLQMKLYGGAIVKSSVILLTFRDNNILSFFERNTPFAQAIHHFHPSFCLTINNNVDGIQ